MLDINQQSVAVYYRYCQRSGSGPPWLMGHFAFSCQIRGQGALLQRCLHRTYVSTEELKWRDVMVISKNVPNHPTIYTATTIWTDCEAVCIKDRSQVALSQWSCQFLPLYCQRSGSGPPWLMGHFAFFCWMKGHTFKVSCYKGASIGHIYGLKSWSGGMWWSSLKTCPIIKNCPKMAVFLFRMTHKFQMLLGKTRQL